MSEEAPAVSFWGQALCLFKWLQRMASFIRGRRAVCTCQSGPGPALLSSLPVSCRCESGCSTRGVGPCQAPALSSGPPVSGRTGGLCDRVFL